MLIVIFAFAVIGEVTGTTFLKQSEQFTKLWPTLAALVFYSIAFYMLSVVFNKIPIGIAYAIWSGLGIVLITGIGLIYFKERIDLAGGFGIGLILSGVIVINLLSKTATH